LVVLPTASRASVRAHVFLQARHFGDSAGIISNGAISVERDDHPGEREHRRGCEGHAEEARELEARDQADDDDDGRKGGGFEADGKALNDVGAVAGLAGARD